MIIIIIRPHELQNETEKKQRLTSGKEVVFRCMENHFQVRSRECKSDKYNC
ncbi:hypothetical protein DsansV1_C13g0120311 [Dioscorea sansibarensis]